MNVPESEESAEGSGDDQKLQFWTAFVNYANEHGRSSDIAKQKAAGRTYYDVHIGANGYHLFFPFHMVNESRWASTPIMWIPIAV